MLSGKVNQALQIGDCSVDKDAFGIVSRCVFWENGIGASRKHENIVGYQIARRSFDCFGLGVDIGDSGVEMVVERSVWKRAILERRTHS